MQIKPKFPRFCGSVRYRNAGRILFRDTIAWLCLSLQKIIINTKTVIPWNITAQTMIITILLHLLVSHQVAFSIGNLSEIGVRKISGTTKLLGATNCLDISPFFLYLDKNFSKLEKIIIKSLQYRRVLLNILQNSTLNKLTNYMLILEKLICTIL